MRNEANGSNWNWRFFFFFFLNNFNTSLPFSHSPPHPLATLNVASAEEKKLCEIYIRGKKCIRKKEAAKSSDFKLDFESFHGYCLFSPSPFSTAAFFS